MRASGSADQRRSALANGRTTFVDYSRLLQQNPRKAAGYGHVHSRRQNGHATPVGSGLSLTLNVHHGRGYRRDRDFMYYPLIISASVPIAVQVIPSVSIVSQRQGTHRSRVSEPTIPDRDCPYRHPTELIFCDQLTYVGVLSEIFGTFLAIRSATNRDKAGPTIRTSIKRAICCAIINPTSTLVDAAIMATESAPPGLVAR